MKKFLKKIFVLMTICISIPSNNFIFAESDEESYLKEDKAITESLGSNMIYAPHTGNVNLDYLYQMIQHHKGAIDMAKNLIKLSGYEPDVDIKIEYTGLRPGEKLYEELLMEEEGLQDTPNHMIHIGKPIEMNEDTFVERLINLKEAAYGETDDIRSLIKELVPTYQYGITPKRRKTPEIKKDSHVQVNEQVQVSKTVNI